MLPASHGLPPVLVRSRGLGPFTLDKRKLTTLAIPSPPRCLLHLQDSILSKYSRLSTATTHFLFTFNLNSKLNLRPPGTGKVPLRLPTGGIVIVFVHFSYSYSRIRMENRFFVQVQHQKLLNFTDIQVLTVEAEAEKRKKRKKRKKGRGREHKGKGGKEKEKEIC